MKKYLVYLLIVILFIPFIVSAKTCDNEKISISLISVEDKSETVNEIEETIVTGKKINLNISMSEVGDSIKYKIMVKNDTPEDLELNNNSFNINSNYIDYNILSEDNSYVVKSKSSKIFFLKIKYANEVLDEAFESGTYNDNRTITIQLSNKEGVNFSNLLKNPNTGHYPYILFVMILIIDITVFVFLRKKKYVKFMILLIGTSILIPISVYALCKYEIKIESKITINKTPAIEPLYLYGRLFGVKIGDSLNLTKIDDGSELIEQYGDIFYMVGETFLTSNKDYMYDLLIEPIFFKYKVEDNIITELGIEYSFNNVRHSLIYGPSHFEANKQVLNDTFGENKCYSTIINNYYCQMDEGSGIDGGTNTDGSISFDLYNFYCSINQYSTSCDRG